MRATVARPTVSARGASARAVAVAPLACRAPRAPRASAISASSATDEAGAVAANANFRAGAGAGGGSADVNNSVTDDDVSSWNEIEIQVANMCAKYAGDSSVNGRIMALAELGPDKTYEALDDITVVDVFQAAYDGGLEAATTIIDVHLRMVAECIIADDVELVRTVYGKFKRMPPLLMRSSVVATAAVAEAGLLKVREEYELIEAMLREEVAKPDAGDEMKLEHEKCEVMMRAMDAVIAVLHEEKGEKDGELVSDAPSVSSSSD